MFPRTVKLKVCPGDHTMKTLWNNLKHFGAKIHFIFHNQSSNWQCRSLSGWVLHKNGSMRFTFLNLWEQGGRLVLYYNKSQTRRVNLDSTDSHKAVPLSKCLVSSDHMHGITVERPQPLQYTCWQIAKLVTSEMDVNRSQVCNVWDARWQVTGVSSPQSVWSQAVTTGMTLTGHSEGLALLWRVTSLCPSGVDKSQACTTEVLSITYCLYHHDVDKSQACTTEVLSITYCLYHRDVDKSLLRCCQ